MPTLPATQKDHEFEVNLHDLFRPCLKIKLIKTESIAQLIRALAKHS